VRLNVIGAQRASRGRLPFFRRDAAVVSRLQANSITIYRVTAPPPKHGHRGRFALGLVHAARCAVNGLPGSSNPLSRRRGQTFAGHALSHVGFAGATGAVLLGLSPLAGLTAFTLLAGLGVGLLDDKLSGRDVAIGMVLSLSLGFGLLFLHFYTSFATQATAVLFGNVLAEDTLWALPLLGTMCLAGLSVIARPLIFASLQPELAEAKGVSLRLIGVLFLGLVALDVRPPHRMQLRREALRGTLPAPTS